MKIKLTKDWPSVLGTSFSKEKGPYYAKNEEVDIAESDAKTAIDNGYATLVKEVKKK